MTQKRREEKITTMIDVDRARAQCAPRFIPLLFIYQAFGFFVCVSFHFNLFLVIKAWHIDSGVTTSKFVRLHLLGCVCQ